ncbi:hypothetical protein JTE90_013346 [Oedothorax gibbosus]|uniref:Uncharacterized protein n=1 Tax=Oedothorax gibbosus TaxID=931172 RepID=A0AAV6VFX3_9ARAC|nr:hypothetical protein JTE90_013346 [Oedothorax gibbosus]
MGLSPHRLRNVGGGKRGQLACGLESDIPRGCGCHGNPSLTVATIFLLHQMRWKAENNDMGAGVKIEERRF